jgi:hypothetical protein
VAVLKHIYETNGPGELKRDFSAAGQVVDPDGRLTAHDGTLTGLNLDEAGLKGVLIAKRSAGCIGKLVKKDLISEQRHDRVLPLSHL